MKLIESETKKLMRGQQKRLTFITDMPLFLLLLRPP